MVLATKETSENNMGQHIDYYINFTDHALTLDLWEAEVYYPAVIVQQLIGNLVYYSNQGRYETRLAESWERVAPNQWKFKLQQGFICENGESITPHSFKKSIERSLFILAKRGDTPVLKGLKGYDKFLLQRNDIFNLDDLEGIKADNEHLILEFSKPIRDGVVQILSFAPFGFICKDNLMADGSWKDIRKFVSSGYFKVSNVELGKRYTLESRIYDHHSDFKTINIYQGLPRAMEESRPVIIDTLRPINKSFPNLHRFDQFKEYVVAIALGNLKEGIFGDTNNRQLFKKVLNWFKNEYLENQKIDAISWTLFPSQDNKQPLLEKAEILRLRNYFRKHGEVIIRGTEPSNENRSFPAWEILHKTLVHLGIRYQFSNTVYTQKDSINQSYDIRFILPSLGGGVEAWMADVLFCSGLNNALPDPTGRICQLILDYQRDNINDTELTTKFLKIVDEDAAIIPIYHYGGQKFFSKHIKLQSISSLVSVIRLDKVEISE